MSLPSSVLGVVSCGEDCVWPWWIRLSPLGDGEDKCVRNPWGITSGILRQYWCGTLRGEYVKISTYLYLLFLCIYWLSYSVFLVGVNPVHVVLCTSTSWYIWKDGHDKCNRCSSAALECRCVKQLMKNIVKRVINLNWFCCLSYLKSHTQ